jgi:hypothetical protein
MSIEEQREAQESMQDHQQNLQQAQSMSPSFSDRREYLEAVIKDELDDATVRMLRNMTSPDFILSNLQDAEINEIKLLREITLKKVYAAHPHPNSAMHGERRKQVYEDGKPAESLSQNQKVLIDQYVRGAFARVARSREGFQQEQFGKTISASERRTEDTDEGGFLSFS